MSTGRGVILITLLAAAAITVLAIRAGSFGALWLTPDQQGRHAYEDKDYARAAGLFEDVTWKGRAQYAVGQYAEAAVTWGRSPTAESFYNRGNAFMKAFEYRPAITAFELALNERPGWDDAQANLELARYTLDYIEQSREQSGTEGMLGADEVRYDNTEARGSEMQVSRESAVEALSAEKWMRSVDTETADFLASRFALESDSREQP